MRWLMTPQQPTGAASRVVPRGETRCFVSCPGTIGRNGAVVNPPAKTRPRFLDLLTSERMSDLCATALVAGAQTPGAPDRARPPRRKG